MNTKRYKEQQGEDIRKSMSSKVAIEHSSKVNSAYKLATIIDKEALTKCRLRQLGRWEDRQRLIEKTEQYTKYEKDRSKATGIGSRTGAFHIGDIPLYTSLEKLYYDTFGEGFDGTDIPSKLNEHYECPHCFHKWSMSCAQLPLKCGCGNLTPLGRLFESGVLKR